MGLELNAGVDAGEMAARGLGFGEGVAGIVFVEEDLALEVGGLDEVAIDEGEAADAGAGEETGGGCAGGADADDGCVRVQKTLLSALADGGEEDLAGVALVVVDFCGGTCVGNASILRGDWLPVVYAMCHLGQYTSGCSEHPQPVGW